MVRTEIYQNLDYESFIARRFPDLWYIISKRTFHIIILPMAYVSEGTPIVVVTIGVQTLGVILFRTVNFSNQLYYEPKNNEVSTMYYNTQ